MTTSHSEQPRQPDRLVARIVTGGPEPVVELTGELDMATAGMLRPILDEALGGEVDALVLDVGGLTFIDTGGVGPLLDAQARLGHPLRVRGISPSFARLRELLALDHVLLDAT